MNVRWKQTGISFRPIVFQIDSVEPMIPPSGAPPDKDKYYETAGCAAGNENGPLRVLWRQEVAAANPGAVSVMLTAGPNRCCSSIVGNADPDIDTYGFYCDLNRELINDGSMWSHEMGHHWGLYHTFKSCEDPVDNSSPDNDNDDDANKSDLSGPVNDTPPDICRFENFTANSMGVPTPGRDEDAANNIIDDHEWCDVTERTDVDDNSPHQTYCTISCKRHVNSVTSEIMDMSFVPPLSENAMSYYGFTCRGPYVVNGVRTEQFSADQVDRIQAARTQIDTRKLNVLPDVCASRGGDTDSDGICDMDDGCPLTVNTCQFDEDNDGIPDACDLCPFNPGSTGDMDGDGIGDICDVDRDGDGCFNRIDQHPDTGSLTVSTTEFPSNLCENEEDFIEETKIPEGVDSDGDGLANCVDFDDDNDGICDDEGSVDGICTSGPDLCPVDPQNNCAFVNDLPEFCPDPWISVCLGTSCFEFVIRIVNLINPLETITSDFQIFNRSILISNLPGLTPSETANAIQFPSFALGTIDDEIPVLQQNGKKIRIEILSKDDSQVVEVVGEFSAEEILPGNTTRGQFLVLTPSENILMLESTYQIGSLHSDVLIDSDSDTRPDSVDNCTDMSNEDQMDSDSDGFGDLCDPDFDGDLMVTQDDLDRVNNCQGITLDIADLIYEPESNDTGKSFGQINEFPGKAAVSLANNCLLADLNGDNIVNFLDINIASAFLGQEPGPSALVSDSESQNTPTSNPSSNGGCSIADPTSNTNIINQITILTICMIFLFFRRTARG